MFDLGPVFRGEMQYAEMVRDIRYDDLLRLTDEMIDTMLSITADATDADVVFEPADPNANDTFGAMEEVDLPWTLGHVVVHATASAEEAAALAVTLARGVLVEGRSRYEVPWETVQTAVQVRERLEESRRMRKAFLQAWPSEPNLDLTYTPIPPLGPINAIGRFMLGLGHDSGHLDQLREIMRQAKEVR